MAEVHPGRHTAQIDGEYVVFVIGMRFNKLWKIHRWVPVMAAMGPMIRELMKHPEKGFLGGRTMIGGRTITIDIQHWRSFDQLEAFARNTDDPHLPAWRAYTKAIGTSGDVGVYHETYRVAPGAYECIYANMPVIGLASASQARHIRIGSPESRARERISAASTSN